MINKVDEHIWVETVVSVTCDKCHNEIEESDFDDMINVEFIGGYSSIFGDGVKVSVDLCQRCFKALVGPYCQVKYDEY